MMKLKFPKKITILGENYKIIYNKNKSGGWFNGDSFEIGIGLKYLEKNQVVVFNIICHEIMELITTLTCTRYTDNGAADYKFFMSHKEFQNNINIFSDVIRNFIK